VYKRQLSDRAIRGGFWVLALRATSQLFVLGRIVILARLLSPDDFGLMGVALLSMSVLETLSYTGFDSALIQRKGNVDDSLNAAWTVGLVRGAAISGILLLFAPLIATFFRSPGTTAIIQVVGLSAAIQATENIGVLYFEKELDFRKRFVFEATGLVASFVTAVVLALVWSNVWALVVALLVKSVVTVISSYAISSYRPRLDFAWDKARELWGYGKWVQGSRILLFLVTEGDDIIVGRLLGTTQLGYYQMAFRISNLPATEIAHTINRVTFPAYAKIQDDLGKLRAAFVKTLGFTAFLAVPVSTLIVVLAEDLTLVLLGEAWLPIVAPMQVIAITGLLRAIAATTNAVFQAVKQPQIDTRWAFVRFAIMAVLIVPLTLRFGIVGAAVSVLVGMAFSTTAFCIQVIDITQCPPRLFARALALPALSAVAMVLVVDGLRLAMPTVGFWQLLVLIAAGGLTYLVAALVGDSYLATGLRPVIQQVAGILVFQATQMRALARK
jgi:O-antigen/teichoic acid export membrane protein